jgi:hypothetical protein
VGYTRRPPLSTRTRGNDDDKRRRRSPALPPLLMSLPSASHSLPLLLCHLLRVPLAVTWHWRSLSLGGLVIAGDDVAVGMQALMQKGGRWLTSGDVEVMWWCWGSKGAVMWRLSLSK